MTATLKKRTKKHAKAKAVRAEAVKTVLVLRTCAADLTSYEGFRWPASGPVEAKDWNGKYHCGGGLHGLLWGEGNGGYLDWSPSAKWLVVRVAESELLHGKGELIDKCKFRCGEVVYSGDRQGATAYIVQNGAVGRTIVGGTATAGDSGTATAGYSGTATAGYRGTATAGYRGTATAGYSGTATAGYRGTATAGDSGTATAGYRGTATAGDSGTATAGKHGLSIGGHEGKGMADELGTIIIRWWDEKANRYRAAVGYVGENGIKAKTLYRVKDGVLVEA